MSRTATTVSLLTDNAVDRRLLTREIRQAFKDVSVLDTKLPLKSPPDMVVVSDRVFTNYHEQIAEHQQAVRPLLLPCILLCSGEMSGLSKVPETVNEVLRIPTSKLELRLRISQQLQAREMSLAIHKHNVASLQESNRQLQEALSRLKEMQQQMIDQEQLRALGQMASGIAHDFNNQLSIITGYCQLLTEKLSPELSLEQVHKDLSHINTAAGDAATIVKRLRKFYQQRENEDEMRPLDLNDVAAESIELTRPHWQHEVQSKGQDISIKTVLASKAPILGDEQELRETMVNLIINAVHAMPDGGEILISTENCDELGVVLSVSDTGIGMDEDTRRHCLDPFFTTKGEDGTGLGLSVVKGVMQRHEAETEIISTPDAGTEIRFTFPPQKGVIGDSEPSIDGECSVAPQRILVVDDKEPVTHMIAEMLQVDGHDVTIELNSRDALDRLENESFSLMITDLAMPGMNGDELARRANAVSPDMKIIMLTGFADKLSAIGKLPDCVNAVLPKPIEMVDLRRTIRDVLSDDSMSATD